MHKVLRRSTKINVLTEELRRDPSPKKGFLGLYREVETLLEMVNKLPILPIKWPTSDPNGIPRDVWFCLIIKLNIK